VLRWAGVPRSKFAEWIRRYGKANEHNALVPRDHWITAEERERILAYHAQHSLEGYRRLTFMMLDDDVVAVSPTTTWRVLSAAGVLDRWKRKPSKKGTGFVQPLKPHEHWHVDIAYLNIRGTFYYLCSVLDGASRAILHFEIHESMKEAQVELILQRAKEKYPNAKPRIITDNGPQFVAREFKDFIRELGMTHVRTAPFYPQSNGKIERWHNTMKNDSIRVTPPESLDEARDIVGGFVDHYNGKRLHSAIGYVTPNDVLAGRQQQIWDARDRKLEAARDARAQRRAVVREEAAAA
jgi:transposase InsO family protein